MVSGDRVVASQIVQGLSAPDHRPSTMVCPLPHGAALRPFGATVCRARRPPAPFGGNLMRFNEVERAREGGIVRGIAGQAIHLQHPHKRLSLDPPFLSGVVRWSSRAPVVEEPTVPVVIAEAQTVST